MVMWNGSGDAGFAQALTQQNPSSPNNLAAAMRQKLGGPDGPRPQPAGTPLSPSAPIVRLPGAYADGTSQVQPTIQQQNQSIAGAGGFVPLLNRFTEYAGMRDMSPAAANAVYGLPPPPAAPAQVPTNGQALLAAAATKGAAPPVAPSAQPQAQPQAQVAQQPNVDAATMHLAGLLAAMPRIAFNDIQKQVAMRPQLGQLAGQQLFERTNKQLLDAQHAVTANPNDLQARHDLAVAQQQSGMLNAMLFGSTGGPMGYTMGQAMASAFANQNSQ